jgi:hypothetical protein
MARRVVAAASPESRRAAKPRDRHRGICRHAATGSAVIVTLDLLTATGEEMIDIPDQVERGEAEANHPRLRGARNKLR